MREKDLHKLIVQKGTKVITSQNIRGRKITLGTSHQADIILPTGDSTALHIAISFDENKFQLHLLNRSAPVYLNAEKLNADASIKANDIINIGDLSIFLQTEEGEVDSNIETLIYEEVPKDRENQFLKQFAGISQKAGFILRNKKFLSICTGIIMMSILIVIVAICLKWQAKPQEDHWQKSKRAFHNNEFEAALTEINAALKYDSLNTGYRQFYYEIRHALKTERLLQLITRALDSANLDSLKSAKQQLMEFDGADSQKQFVFRLFLRIETKLDSLRKRKVSTLSKAEVRPVMRKPERSASEFVPSKSKLKKADENLSHLRQNQPPIIKEIWIEKKTLPLGGKTNIGAYTFDKDGDSLMYHWSAIYGKIISRPRDRFVYQAPDSMPDEGKDLLTLVVEDAFSSSKKNFKTISIYAIRPLTIRQKALAEKYYRMGYREEMDYHRPHKAAEYYKKAMGVAPDPEFGIYRKALKRLRGLEENE